MLIDAILLPLQLIICNHWLLQCCKMMLHGSSLHNQSLRQQPHSSSSSMNSVIFLVLPLSATWSTEAQLRVVLWRQKSYKSFMSRETDSQWFARFFDARHCNWLGMDYRFKSKNYLGWFTVACGLEALLFCFPSTIPTSHDWSTLQGVSCPDLP